MNNKMKITSICVIVAILMLTVVSAGDTIKPATTADPTVQITDLVGRTIEIPANVTRVASLTGQGYEKLLVLDQIDRVSATCAVPSSMPWAYKIAPQLRDIPTVESVQDPNVEDLLSKNIQVAISLYFEDAIEKMTEVGIPVVVVQYAANSENSGLPQSEEEFASRIKNEMRLYGKVMGPKAEENAEKWCNYFDKKMNFIKSRTKNLNSSQRPRVFYSRGPDPQTTHTKGYYTQWYVEVAGGDYVAKNVTGSVAQAISMEQIIKWNPDFIILGRINETGIVMNDPKWKDIKAVQDENVYLCPAGVAYWDGGSEGVLFMEFLAKTIHPELFEDLDMIKEVKDYYSKFFRYELTDYEANRILKHLPPD
jgi:iron complex transport system substrate-binding protein